MKNKERINTESSDRAQCLSHKSTTAVHTCNSQTQKVQEGGLSSGTQCRPEGYPQLHGDFEPTRT